MPSQFRDYQKSRSLAKAGGAFRLGMTLRQVIELMNTSRMNKAYKPTKQQIADDAESAEFTDAALGTIEDAIAIGLTQHGKYYLGQLDGTPLYWDGDLGVAVLGPAGTGKSSTLVIPNIINQGGICSTIVADIKGELSWASYSARETMDGADPVLLNPWHMHEWHSERLNPFQDVINLARHGIPIVDIAHAKIRMLFGDPNSEGANAWIKKEAMRRCVVRLIYLAHKHPDYCTPGKLWDMATATIEHTADMFAVMAQADIADGYVARISQKICETYERDDEHMRREHGYVTEAIESELSLFGLGTPLRDFTSETTVDLSTLKQHPRAIFFMIPDMYAISHAKAVSLIFDTLIELVARSGGPHPVSFLIDEFANLPKMDVMIKALRLYRDRGIHISTFVQDRGGYDAYNTRGGAPGLSVFEGNMVCLSWGIQDTRHAKSIEDRAGQRYITTTNLNVSENLLAGGSGSSSNRLLFPVLPISEISRVSFGQAILEIPGKKTFILDRVPWWEIPDVADYVVNPREAPMPVFRG